MIERKKQKILVVVGQTATGKSDLAVFLARQFNGEVISADSRQVYRGMDIGTGKITKKEAGGIKHYLIDIAKPKEKFSVERYRELATESIEETIKKNKIPIICGGTGLYINSILYENWIPNVPPNLTLRKRLENKTLEELKKELKEIDPERAAAIDNNKRRIIRALEIAEIFGKVPKLKKIPNKRFSFLKIGLKIDPGQLARKIDERLDKRIKTGMIKEVEALHSSGVSWKRMAEFGLEYKWVTLYLRKKISREEMTMSLSRAIKQYAKRQNTWFKRDKEIFWFNPGQRKEVGELTKKFLTEN